jgi:hypothetical protein
MLICSEMGISHSEFLEWSGEDRAKAMAFQIEKAMKCAMCGTAEWEWDENRRAYEPVEKFCMGCYLKAITNEDAGALPGTTISLVPTSTVESAKRLTRLKRMQQEG